MSRKVFKELGMINGVDGNDTMRKQLAWLDANNQRNKYLNELRKEGLKGVSYSNAVVEYDRQFQQVFEV